MTRLLTAGPQPVALLPAPKRSANVTRPALRYYGSKWRLAPWLIQHMPPHTCYVDVLGGSAAVLLRKSPAVFDVYNDIDHEVVNFFEVLRTRTGELIWAIRWTPYGRAELERAYAPTKDPLESARRFYVRAWQAYHPGRPHMNTGWRRQYRDNRGKSVVGDWNSTARLWQAAERLKQVQIECDTWENVLANYDTPDTLFYVDPPYVPTSRSQRWRAKGYAHDMAEEDHRRLAERLHELSGMVLLSGYPSELYADLFADWQHVERQASTNGNTQAAERLWMSPRTAEGICRQLSFIEPN